MRKDMLIENQIYHIFTKSIAGFKIFNNEFEFIRMKDAIRHYQKEERSFKLSQYLSIRQNNPEYRDINISSNLIEIIAYCLMPTHVHLILQQLKPKGISIFMSNILNSYARYFNIKHNRKGPLWEGRFKSVLVKNDEQLLHLTRYIHLNPVTAFLSDEPEGWSSFSSYKEYVCEVDANDRFCNYHGILDIKPVSYRKFVEDRIGYQREIAKIKELLLEQP